MFKVILKRTTTYNAFYIAHAIAMVINLPLGQATQIAVLAGLRDVEIYSTTDIVDARTCERALKQFDLKVKVLNENESA